MIDLSPVAADMSRLLAAVPDDRLAAPTPCPRYTLGDLIEHVDGLSLAFAGAAAKQPDPGAPRPGDVSRLRPGWRERIPVQLAALADAWRDPAAWDGMTSVGGVELPGAVAGTVGLNELVVHGWDIARASDQPFAPDPAAVDGAMRFLAATADQRGTGNGAFGPVVPVRQDAPALDRLIGLSGRDPAWAP